ncbi:ribonuclease S-7 [Spatholobus suberectus]|nr:ribonuclease S-7 [Spatholobus suberectus]
MAEHEWEKHETCSKKKFIPLSYLEKVLEIKKSDLMIVLERAKIVPHQTIGYDKDSVVHHNEPVAHYKKHI